MVWHDQSMLGKLILPSIMMLAIGEGNDIMMLEIGDGNDIMQDFAFKIMSLCKILPLK